MRTAATRSRVPRGGPAGGRTPHAALAAAPGTVPRGAPPGAALIGEWKSGPLRRVNTPVDLGSRLARSMVPVGARCDDSADDVG